jgi:uncharacterized protein YjbI with pentapeptide repeats
MGAELRGVNMTNAKLRGAILSGADLRGAILAGTDFRCADLLGVSLGGATVDQDTNFLDAKVNEDIFRDVNLALIKREHLPASLRAK